MIKSIISNISIIISFISLLFAILAFFSLIINLLIIILDFLFKLNLVTFINPILNVLIVVFFIVVYFLLGFISYSLDPPEPEKTFGELIKIKEGFRCSNCGWTEENVPEIVEKCQNCGIKLKIRL